MERFIHEQNLALFKRLLAEEPDMNHKRRKMILQLLSEEEAKDHFPPSRKPSGDQSHRFLLNSEK